MMAQNGVAQIIVKDEREGAETARAALSLLRRDVRSGIAQDQTALRDLMPRNRKAVLEIAALIRLLTDDETVIEMAPDHAANIRTALARIDGHPVAILANDSSVTGSAIDGLAAAKAARLFALAQKHGLPIVSLIDTPGFMVGPEAEATGQAREIGAMFRDGAALTVPLVAIVLRRAYGLGAMAMAGGGLQAADLCVSWPSGEVGAMGLEGATRLGARAQIDKIGDDEAEREREVQCLVGELEQRGRAINAAVHFEFDDVIDPAETRARIVQALTAAGRASG